jgi:hypothetical protein
MNEFYTKQVVAASRRPFVPARNLMPVAKTRQSQFQEVAY